MTDLRFPSRPLRQPPRPRPVRERLLGIVPPPSVPDDPMVWGPPEPEREIIGRSKNGDWALVRHEDGCFYRHGFTCNGDLLEDGKLVAHPSEYVVNRALFDARYPA